MSGWEPGAHDAIAALGAGAIMFQPPGLYRELFDLNTTTAVLTDPVRRRALVGSVRAMIDASTEIRTKPASVWPLLSSRIKVEQATISDTWTHFRFSASLPEDSSTSWSRKSDGWPRSRSGHRERAHNWRRSWTIACFAKPRPLAAPTRRSPRAQRT